MKKCPQCKGSGRQPVDVGFMKTGWKDDSKIVFLPCKKCYGKGTR